MRVRWHWKLRRILAALFAAFVCFCPASLAQDGELDPSQPKDITANAIIERFAAKEREWKQLREQYVPAVGAIPGDGWRPGGWGIPPGCRYQLRAGQTCENRGARAPIQHRFVTRRCR